MKRMRAYLVMLLLLSGTLVASNDVVSAESTSVSLQGACLECEGVSVELVIDELADYTGMTTTYIHENLVAFHSYGQDTSGDEYGYITVETEEGPESWNWRYGGNIMVVWPT